MAFLMLTEDDYERAAQALSNRHSAWVPEAGRDHVHDAHVRNAVDLVLGSLQEILVATSRTPPVSAVVG